MDTWYKIVILVLCVYLVRIQLDIKSLKDKVEFLENTATTQTILKYDFHIKRGETNDYSN